MDSCTSGYSAHLTLWWRSLYLINVPGFKYYTALIGIIAMIVLMLSLDECFGAATQLQCFDMISKSPANPFAGWFDFASGPFLQESSSGPVDTVDVSSGTFERDFSESQESHRSKALYALFFVYPVAILPGMIRSGGSMASAHSLITAVAAALNLCPTVPPTETIRLCAILLTHLRHRPQTTTQSLGHERGPDPNRGLT